jgi:hypothetical protein
LSLDIRFQAGSSTGDCILGRYKYPVNVADVLPVVAKSTRHVFKKFLLSTGYQHGMRQGVDRIAVDQFVLAKRDRLYMLRLSSGVHSLIGCRDIGWKVAAPNHGI